MRNRGAQKLHDFRRQASGEMREGVNAGQPIPMRRIAAKLGCDTTYIQKLEAGTRTPGLMLAMRLQELGVAKLEDWTKPAQAPDRSAA